jgi:hypothetical protein
MRFGKCIFDHRAVQVNKIGGAAGTPFPAAFDLQCIEKFTYSIVLANGVVQMVLEGQSTN